MKGHNSTAVQQVCLRLEVFPCSMNRARGVALREISANLPDGVTIEQSYIDETLWLLNQTGS